MTAALQDSTLPPAVFTLTGGTKAAAQEHALLPPQQQAAAAAEIRKKHREDCSAAGELHCTSDTTTAHFRSDISPLL
jgi:hypothetical protein